MKSDTNVNVLGGRGLSVGDPLAPLHILGHPAQAGITGQTHPAPGLFALPGGIKTPLHPVGGVITAAAHDG